MELGALTYMLQYLPEDVLEAGVKSMRFIKGPLYVSGFNRLEAFVHLQENSALGKDLFIPSSVSSLSRSCALYSCLCTLFMLVCPLVCFCISA